MDDPGEILEGHLGKGLSNGKDLPFFFRIEKTKLPGKKQGVMIVGRKSQNAATAISGSPYSKTVVSPGTKKNCPFISFTTKDAYLPETDAALLEFKHFLPVFAYCFY